MIITKFEELGKGKVKVYIDEEFHFILYHKDISIHHLNENDFISDVVYNDIEVNTVLRRAKQKALAILKFMNRTEYELVNKLKQADYTDKIIDSVINYVKAYHYIDDIGYAHDYVRCKKDTKSKRQLQMELMQKGIEKDKIEQAILEEYDNETLAIKKAIEKKCKNLDNLTPEDKMKISAYLYRKGYQLDLIKQHLNSKMDQY